jgi:U3 small nucleolar RNA-associated protein MPP10
MESALPTTNTVTTMLAPEEIFSAPKDIRSCDELTSNEKRAQRNKQKKLRRKMKGRFDMAMREITGARSTKGASTVKRDKAKAMKEVVKAGKGITVIGKESAHVKRQAKRRQGGLLDAKKLKL